MLKKHKNVKWLIIFKTVFFLFFFLATYIHWHIKNFLHISLVGNNKILIKTPEHTLQSIPRTPLFIYRLLFQSFSVGFWKLSILLLHVRSNINIWEQALESKNFQKSFTRVKVLWLEVMNWGPHIFLTEQPGKKLMWEQLQESLCSERSESHPMIYTKNWTFHFLKCIFPYLY